MFADKRRVLHPIPPSPTAPSRLVKLAYTTDPLRESANIQFTSSGEAMREVMDLPRRLEGTKSRAAIEGAGDEAFEALVTFVKGARYDQMITGRRFQKAYDALTHNDDVFVWLCMTAMAVLNPGDMRSRLLYRHFEALATAVAAGEMTQRTAFAFYEQAVRSPAYREIAARNLETGASSRLAGICAAADMMKRLGLCRRPMAAYFELYQRIMERSETNTPWGFPPLFQFEERLGLEKRLKFFGRDNQAMVRRKSRGQPHFAKAQQFLRHRVYWIPLTWKTNRRWVGNHYKPPAGIVPD